MENEYLKRIDEEFEYYRKNKIYPIVDKDLVNKIIDIKIKDSIKDHNKYVIESYIEHLETLKNLDPNHLKNYLMVLKNADIKDNQKLVITLVIGIPMLLDFILHVILKVI